jgi:hypothetical protein
MAEVHFLRHWVGYIYPHTAWSRAIGALSWFPLVPLDSKNGAAPQLLPRLEGRPATYLNTATGQGHLWLVLKLSRSGVGPDTDYPDWYFSGFRHFIQENPDESNHSDSLPPSSTVRRMLDKLTAVDAASSSNWTSNLPSVRRMDFTCYRGLKKMWIDWSLRIDCQ